jgi:phosphoserine phosphatase
MTGMDGDTMSEAVLPSWRPGPTREALLTFLDASLELPVEQRVAVFDNDGTLWVERPDYPQYEFLRDALTSAVAADPQLADRPEFAAVLTGDLPAIAELGLERVAMALTGLFDGATPEAFGAAVQSFMDASVHPTLAVPLQRCVYQPMVELIDELRRRRFTVAIVTGGGTEFVRAISQQLYGVAPELVVGTLIDYDVTRDASGVLQINRANRLMGGANEGRAKVAGIQRHLGRRPVLAAGNSGGDREMLEWAISGDGPGMALLIDHDDAEREFAYVSTATTFTEEEPIIQVGRRLGFTIVSMSADWHQILTG